MHENDSIQTKFMLSHSSRKDYANLMKIDWEILLDPNLELRLSSKDLLILKLYFALMGKDYYINSTKVFVGLCKKFFIVNKLNLCISLLVFYRKKARAMNPELTFNFSVENIEKIKSLLHVIKSEVALLSDAKTIHLFDLFAVMVNEALQFANLVPNSRSGKEDQIMKSLKKYEKIKKRMQRLFSIVHNNNNNNKSTC